MHCLTRCIEIHDMHKHTIKYIPVQCRTSIYNVIYASSFCKIFEISKNVIYAHPSKNVDFLKELQNPIVKNVIYASPQNKIFQNFKNVIYASRYIC